MLMQRRSLEAARLLTVHPLGTPVHEPSCLVRISYSHISLMLCVLPNLVFSTPDKTMVEVEWMPKVMQSEYETLLGISQS